MNASWSPESEVVDRALGDTLLLRAALLVCLVSTASDCFLALSWNATLSGTGKSPIFASAPLLLG